MPHYRFTPQQIATLVAFLQAKSDSDYGSGVHLDAASPQQIAHGRKLIVELGCAACHEINGVQKPENFAPELSTIGSKPLAQIVFLPGMEHSLPSYIVAKIRQPRAFGSSVKMPQFTLTASQTDALTTALLALTARGRAMPDNLRVAAIPETELPACRPRGQADHRTCLLQLPPLQRQGRRHGARSYAGKEARCSGNGSLTSCTTPTRCAHRSFGACRAST